MQGADCFVCPSLWAEAAGLVNLEAQSSGLPTVASNVGGIPEYVADGKTGFLFSPGNATELADRIRQLLSDAALYAAPGEHCPCDGRERVLSERPFGGTSGRLPILDDMHPHHASSCAAPEAQSRQTALIVSQITGDLQRYGIARLPNTGQSRNAVRHAGRLRRAPRRHALEQSRRVRMH